TSGLLDDSHRSLTLEFDVGNPDNQLSGGDYAQVQLRLQRKSATLWVPVESLLQTQSGTYVLTVQDGSIHRVPVQEGIRLDSLTEVFGQFSSEDHILSKPSEEIKEGPVDQSS
ncbi:MAG: efflux RND transporter periplasmic adaptor subunit, partial [Sphingobacterium sp.]